MTLQSLITAFRANQLDPSAEELADAIWFALQIVPPIAQPTDANLPSDKQSQPVVKAKYPSTVTKPLFDKIEGNKIHPRTTTPTEVSTQFISSRPVRTPAAPMLPDKLSLGRALRPLMRKISSRNRYILNEEATVQHIAETRRKVWLPVLKGAPERWLKVALVIDKNASMVIWQPLITDLRRFLEGHGAFQKIETWHLDVNPSNPNETQLYACGENYSRLCSPKELIDPTQRNLILVVSDCVSLPWYTGIIAKLLSEWEKVHPIVIIQMLPVRLWSETALGEIANVSLYATASNLANTHLTIDKTAFGLEEEETQGLKMPVVTLEPESLGNWARLITGKPDAKVAGVVLKTEPLNFSETSVSAPLSAIERLEAFYASASLYAQKLAGYLAAVPLTLDVMRLIQQVMLPESRQVHLAEVFLGGLLKRVSAADVSPQQIEYDFHDGVRELLLDSVLVPEVLEVVSMDLERRFGHCLDFQALLPDPTAINGPQIDKQGRYFAHLSAKVLRRLGGDYARLAQQLENEKEQLENESSNTPTVFFLTALPVEYKAVKAYVSQNLTEEWNTAKTKVYEIGEYLTPQNVSCRVILRQQSGMGNLFAVQETEEAIAKYQPNYLIFVGIAGGLKDVDLGDVVVAESVTGYETVKVQGGDILPRSHRVYASKHLAEKARQLIRNEQWLNKIKPFPVPEPRKPKAIVAAIISGEKLVDSKPYLEQLRRHHSDATALEMEGLGFLQAISDKPDLEGIVICGISDLIVTIEDRDEWYTIAASHAADFAFALLDELLVKVKEQPSADPGLSTFRPDETEDFSRLKERYIKVFSTTAEPEYIALDSRKFAETLCRYLFTQEIGKEPDKPYSLEDYLNLFKQRRSSFGYIYPHLETIQKLGNYAGHDQPDPTPISREFIRPALSAVDVLMNWCVHTRLQRPNLQFSEGKMIENSLTPPIVCKSNHYELEMVGGAIPLDSKFYIERSVDNHLQMAIARHDSIVLLKGARQVGKTSLLARGLQQARALGVQVLLTDFQRLDSNELGSLENFFIALGEMLAEQLGLDISPQDHWNKHRTPTMNFDRFFQRELLSKTDKPILWAIDDADRLFLCPFSSEVFSLLRVWHNERALNPDNPYHRLTISIAYATESYLFIKDQNQSPFNVGTKLIVEDFSLEQMQELHQRYGAPLNDAELRQFFELTNGQPYLARCGFNEIVAHRLPFVEFLKQAYRDEGPFGDHLQRLVMLISKETKLTAAVHGVLAGKPCPDNDSFYCLRGLGILTGESKDKVRLRCELYARYLKEHLQPPVTIYSHFNLQ